MWFNVLILFCLIFSFPLPVGGNSFLLAFAMSAPRVFLSRSRRTYFYSLLTRKYTLSIFSLAFLLSLLSFVYVVLVGTYDFEKSYALFSQILTFIIGLLVLASLNGYEKDYEYLCKCIIIVFVIQSLIQVCAFLSLDIRRVVHAFQFAADQEIADYYGGIRGLAMSGRLFFELAAVYGLVFFLFIKYLYDNKLYSYSYIFAFILLFVASFFVGRTSIIAFAMACFFLLMYARQGRVKKRILVKLVFAAGVIIALLAVFLPPEIKEILVDKLLPWVFELVYKYVETGHAQSNSLDTLEGMYDIEITNREWLIGSGHYTNPDGTYYKHTDSGYLRQILFWGLPGSFLNLIYMLSFFYLPIKYQLRNRLANKNELLFLGILLLYICILHYKGELMGHSRFFLSLLFIYLVKYEEKWKR